MVISRTRTVWNIPFMNMCGALCRVSFSWKLSIPKRLERGCSAPQFLSFFTSGCIGEAYIRCNSVPSLIRFSGKHPLASQQAVSETWRKALCCANLAGTARELRKLLWLWAKRIMLSMCSFPSSLPYSWTLCITLRCLSYFGDSQQQPFLLARTFFRRSCS